MTVIERRGESASLELPDPAAAIRPVERVKVRLRLRDKARFPFLHGAALRELLSRLHGPGMPAGIFPVALESGHVAYAPGDAYDFVLAAVGDSRASLPAMVAALHRVGEGRRPAGSEAVLVGNYDLQQVELLPQPAATELLGRVAALSRQNAVKLHFPAPLRLRLPPELQRAGAGDFGAYFGADCFPAALFLDHLWQRLGQLSSGALPYLPALPEAAKAGAGKLHWLDLPMPDQQPFGGVGGSLLLEQVPAEWLRLLVQLEGCPLGEGEAYGFGGYAIETLPFWQRPARTFAERLGPDADSPQAVATILAPAATALLDEGAAAHQKGLSRWSAEEGLRRAKELGLNGSVGGAGTRFVAGLASETVMARLEALWPGEPLVERFRGWLEIPQARNELTRLLGKIFAVELAESLEKEGRRLVRMGCELRVLGREAARVG